MASGMLSIVRLIQTDGSLTGGGTDDLVTLSRPDGVTAGEIYQNVHLLQPQPQVGPQYMAGRATLSLGPTWAVAGVVVKKLEKQMNGTWVAIYDSTTGIAGNSTVLPQVLDDQPLDGNESFRVTLNKAAAGALVGYVLVRYELGISADRASATPVL